MPSSPGSVPGSRALSSSTVWNPVAAMPGTYRPGRIGFPDRSPADDGRPAGPPAHSRRRAPWGSSPSPRAAARSLSGIRRVVRPWKGAGVAPRIGAWPPPSRRVATSARLRAAGGGPAGGAPAGARPPPPEPPRLLVLVDCSLPAQPELAWALREAARREGGVVAVALL